MSIVTSPRTWTNSKEGKKKQYTIARTQSKKWNISCRINKQRISSVIATLQCELAGGASQIAQLVKKKTTCNAGNPSSIPGSGRSTGEGIGYPLQYSWASLVAQLVKNPPAMQENWVWSLGWKGKGYPFQYSSLENLKNCKVHGVAKSQARLNDFHFHFLSTWAGEPCGNSGRNQTAATPHVEPEEDRKAQNNDPT